MGGTIDLANQLVAALSAVSSTAASTASSVTNAAAAARAAADSITQDAARAGRAAAELEANVNSSASRTQQAINNLRDIVGNTNTGIAIVLREQIALLETGGVRMDEFLSKFGNVTVTTEQGLQKIRDLIDGATLDAQGKVQEIAKLATEIQRTGSGVDKALALLKGAAADYAKELARVYEEVRRGELPLKRLADLVAGIKRTLGDDNALGNLAGALLDDAAKRRL